MRQRRREATVNASKSPEVHHREDKLATVQIKPVNLFFSAATLPSCSSLAAKASWRRGKRYGTTI
jgi:hypothetical protein